MYTKHEAYQKIEELVTRFGEQIQSYKKTDYNETLVRRNFIDPFFIALGWDVDNSQGYAEAYREVIHEDKIKVGSATKALDYSFRLPGSKCLFFVEAKKPSVAVKTDIANSAKYVAQRTQRMFATSPFLSQSLRLLFINLPHLSRLAWFPCPASEETKPRKKLILKTGLLQTPYF